MDLPTYYGVSFFNREHSLCGFVMSQFQYTCKDTASFSVAGLEEKQTSKDPSLSSLEE